MNRGLSSIRTAEPQDLVLLSEFWYDRMTLLMQSSPSLRLLPDARIRWETAASTWLNDEAVVFLVGLAEQEVVGGIAGKIESNAPGLAPENIMRIADLVIDLHTIHKQQGIGRMLLNALRDQAREKGITRMVIQAAAGLAVEQAFWRGMGAKSYAELFWMDV